MPTIALAGYTNVGKSTLLNALTGAEVSVENRLFETLDPTTRGYEHDGRRYLLTDTVGFIRRLPHQLVEGFAATLEETLVADLVLHVADASAPEEQLEPMVAAVDDVLARDRRRRASRAARPQQDRPRRRGRPPAARATAFPDAPQVSAETGEGLERAEARGSPSASRAAWRRCGCSSPTTRAARLSELYALGAPIEEREDTPEGVLVVARLPRHELLRFARVPDRRRAGPAPGDPETA